jgi:hypothetical protein
MVGNSDSPNRDALRSAILGERPTSSIVTLDNGMEIEVREGAVGSTLDAVSVTDLKKRMARMLIEACYVPGTNDKVFEETDFDALMQLPASGTYTKLMNAITARMDLGLRLEQEEKG